MVMAVTAGHGGDEGMMVKMVDLVRLLMAAMVAVASAGGLAGDSLERRQKSVYNQVGSSKNVLDDKALKDSRNGSDFDLDRYLNDEEDNGDNIFVPQTSSEVVRTRIYNTGITSSLIRGTEEGRILDKIGTPLSPNHTERGYSICCENTINMINSIKDLREENRDMLSSINEAIKIMLAVATNMSCVNENDIRKEESKDNLKE
uniref:Uncharacterized protein n=1 Tax=Tanacetum cinerariifolium TaxID=118510 RepID=A0A6L2N2M4_TANCI|nr:hypothetical protein CTI12_AA382530 [Tanacetum cinerariifolium]